MGFPSVLKNMDLHQDGGTWMGLTDTVTLPKVTRKMEGYRGGGLDTELELDMGGEKLTLEFSLNGMVRDMIGGMGGTLTGKMLRFTGAYQDDNSGEVITVDVTVRGRYNELDLGEQKVGEVGKSKATVSCAYYRLDWNGATVIEIDVLGMIWMVDGVDQLAAIREAIR